MYRCPLPLDSIVAPGKFLFTCITFPINFLIMMTKLADNDNYDDDYDNGDNNNDNNDDDNHNEDDGDNDGY